MKRTFLATAAAVVTLMATGSPALAHSQLVTPPGQDDAVVTGPISRLWAQAHCHAASPGVLADHEVVSFIPADNLPCLDTWSNPGGQTNPHNVPAP